MVTATRTEVPVQMEPTAVKETAMVPEKATKPMVTRWNPFERMAQMQAELDRFFTDTRFPPMFGHKMGDWMPRTDVFEKDGTMVVKAELPGMKKEDIDVAIEAGELVIQGKLEAEEKIEEKDYQRMERTFGTFYRRLPLPDGVKTDQITAAYGDGVLEVKIPKPTMTKPETTRIPVQ